MKCPGMAEIMMINHWNVGVHYVQTDPNPVNMFACKTMLNLVS